MRLLTHNAYWFQGSPSRWGEERVAAVPAVVASLTALYREARADLVALQEVHDPALASGLARDGQWTRACHAPGGQLPDYGGVLLASDAGTTFEDPTRAEPEPHERCHMRAALPDGDSTLTIAAVHLPSNRRAPDRAAGEALRVAELSRVLETTPRPDVVMGDFNARPGEAPYQAMLEAGYVDAAAAVEAPPLHWRSRIDYIWLSEATLPRLRGYTVLDAPPFEQTSDEGETWRLSDHPPLLVELAEASLRPEAHR